MTIQDVPWLELSVLAAVLGAGATLVSRAAMGWAVAACAASFVLACCEWLPLHMGWPAPRRLVPWLAVDGFSAPLLPLVALLHLLTALSAPRAEGGRDYFALLLLSLAVQLLTFGCTAPWLLVAFMGAGAAVPLADLLARGRPVRLFAAHMALFLGLLASGVGCLLSGGTAAGQALVLAAALVRCGTVPAHAWVPGLFEHARFGTALVFAAPLVGAYAAVRLVLPQEPPEWVLKGLGFFSLLTALVAAGLAMVQREARRFFAYLFLSHVALVMVGLEIRSAVSLTGAFALWIGLATSLGGLGLVLRAVEARFGTLGLDDYRGLYRHSPTLAGCFLLMGLASVGFPGTLGFIAGEVLVDGAVRHSPVPGFVLIAAGAMNGIAVMRAYFLLFAGPGHASSVPLGITPRERLAVFVLTALVIGGGLFPQPGIASRHRAALAVLNAEAPPAEGH